MRDVKWFKENVEPLLSGYTLEYKTFKDGDFGDLERVEFNSVSKLCCVYFWTSGVLEIEVADAKTIDVIMNVFLFGDQKEEQYRKLDELVQILKQDLRLLN